MSKTTAIVLTVLAAVMGLAFTISYLVKHFPFPWDTVLYTVLIIGLVLHEYYKPLNSRPVMLAFTGFFAIMGLTGVILAFAQPNGYPWWFMAFLLMLGIMMVRHDHSQAKEQPADAPEPSEQ